MEKEIVRLTQQLGEEEKALEILQEGCKGTSLMHQCIPSWFCFVFGPFCCFISWNDVCVLLTSSSQEKLRNAVSNLPLFERSLSLGRSTSLNAKARLTWLVQKASSWRTRSMPAYFSTIYMPVEIFVTMLLWLLENFTFSWYVLHRNTDNFWHRRSTVEHCISCSFCVGDFIFAIKTLFVGWKGTFPKSCRIELWILTEISYDITKSLNN